MRTAESSNTYANLGLLSKSKKHILKPKCDGRRIICSDLEYSKSVHYKPWFNIIYNHFTIQGGAFYVSLLLAKILGIWHNYSLTQQHT